MLLQKVLDHYFSFANLAVDLSPVCHTFKRPEKLHVQVAAEEGKAFLKSFLADYALAVLQACCNLIPDSLESQYTQLVLHSAASKQSDQKHAVAQHS